MEETSESLFDKVSTETLLYMFRFFKKREVLCTRLTCKRFNEAFNDDHLMTFINNNTSADLRDMSPAELLVAIHHRPADVEFILIVVREIFLSGRISYSMLRNFILKIPMEVFFKVGRFFEFKNPRDQIEFDFFLDLSSRVVCSPEYYSGEIESRNSLFMSLVKVLGRVDMSNLNLHPRNKEAVIILFQYAVLSLSEESTLLEPLRQIFEEFFFEKNKVFSPPAI